MTGNNKDLKTGNKRPPKGSDDPVLQHNKFDVLENMDTYDEEEDQSSQDIKNDIQNRARSRSRIKYP
jgi:hypothetical protein